MMEEGWGIKLKGKLFQSTNNYSHHMSSMYVLCHNLLGLLSLVVMHTSNVMSIVDMVGQTVGIFVVWSKWENHSVKGDVSVGPMGKL
jgi:hypothetical protein